MRARVFVPTKKYHDLSDAERFGEVVVLSTKNIDIRHPDRIRLQMEAALSDFDEEVDYLAMAGSVILCSFALVALKNGHRRKVQLLIWDAKERKYICKTITLGEEHGYCE